MQAEREHRLSRVELAATELIRAARGAEADVHVTKALASQPMTPNGYRTSMASPTAGQSTAENELIGAEAEKEGAGNNRDLQLEGKTLLGEREATAQPSGLEELEKQLKEKDEIIGKIEIEQQQLRKEVEDMQISQSESEAELEKLREENERLQLEMNVRQRSCLVT